MNTTQLKEKIMMMKDKSEKYDKLFIENNNLINNYYQISYETQELTAINTILKDKISILIGEIDDLKGCNYKYKNQISLLNNEINELEVQIELYQKKYNEVSLEKNEYFEFSIELKDRITDLQGFANLYHEKSSEVEHLKFELNKLIFENNELKTSQSTNNDLLKTVIDEIGSFEWDIVSNDETMLS